MAKIIVTEVPWAGYASDVRLDGRNLEGAEGLREGEVIEFDLPSRARATALAKKVFRLRPDGIYLVLYASYNASREPRIDEAEGLEKIFEYGDGHGRRWAALFKVVDATWRVDYTFSGHHDHSWIKRRIRGTKDSFQNADAERKLEEAPLV